MSTDNFRVRVVLWLDRPVTPSAWRDLWLAVNRELLCGLADPQTGKPAQQAGVWAVHPERMGCAFRSHRDGALLSVDALLALVPEKPEPRPRSVRPVAAGDQVSRYAEALGMLDAKAYTPWMLALGGLKGGVIVGELTDNDGAALWFAFSDSGGIEAQAMNADGRYNPESLWINWTPTVAPAPALVGRLFGAARNAALQRCKAEHEAGGCLTDEGLKAARYLAKYHRRTFDELTSEVQA